MSEVGEAIKQAIRGRTDTARDAHDIIVLDSCKAVLGSPVNKHLFANFPDKVWLVAALRALYRYECKNQGQKIHREKLAKQVDQTNNHITTNANNGTQTPENNKITVAEVVGPNPLLPLDINPRWKEQCPATFPRILKTLAEARKDSRYLELWKGRLPKVSQETPDRASHIAGMMFPIIRNRGKQHKFSVGVGGQDVEDADLRDTCIGKALYQVHRQSIDTDEEMCVIRNVVVKEARHMSPNSAWAQGAPVCRQQPAEGQSFIAAPKGYFTDFHNGTSRVKLTKNTTVAALIRLQIQEQLARLRS